MGSCAHGPEVAPPPQLRNQPQLRGHTRNRNIIAVQGQLHSLKNEADGFLDHLNRDQQVVIQPDQFSRFPIIPARLTSLVRKRVLQGPIG